MEKGLKVFVIVLALPIIMLGIKTMFAPTSTNWDYMVSSNRTTDADSSFWANPELGPRWL